MDSLRIIPRLDIKGENLIKSIQFEGLRVIGDPQEHAIRYYEAGADELLYMDVVASLYGRNSLNDIVKKAAYNVFIPITVGGGIRSLDDARNILRSGADKVAVNTAAVANPNLIRDIAQQFGSQAMVVSIEAKQVSDQKWEAYTENGREPTGLDVLEWVQQAVELGAGELLVTSVDREGTRKGFDIELIRRISSLVPVPVVACGGMGTAEHFVKAAKEGMADAIGMADVLHYQRMTIAEIRAAAQNAGLPVRKF